VQARCLSFHAAYRCRHSGECCRAGWDVEVDPHIVNAVRTGRVLPVISTPSPFEPLAEGEGVAPSRTSSGDCGFHNNNRCSLQETGSEAMLPSACRHFPRVFLRDGRGLLMTLSHFCPTAASLLLQPGSVSIIEAPESLMIAEPIEGLDAREALPPLVRPGLLTDVEGYAIWEESVVRTFIETPDVELALSRVTGAAERARLWTPSHGSFSASVVASFERPERMPYDPKLSTPFQIVRELTGAHPLMDVPAEFARAWDQIRHVAGDALSVPVRRYLAASAFGNWIAYRGEGLRSVVAWLRACHDVLRLQIVRRLADTGTMGPEDIVESLRMADYIMIHTVDSLAFGRAAAALEH
jgi:hypothetical protein